MKVSLNLLPEEKKALLRRRILDRFLFRQSLYLLGVVGFYLALLGGVFLIVRENRFLVESIEREYSGNDAGIREVSRYTSEFREANALAAQAARFQKTRPDWAGFLARLERSTPNHISFDSITTKEYRIFLSGVAATRDDFLAFESALKSESCFSDFEIPVSNLFSEKNVEFQVDFTVKDTCLQGSRTL
ncbi:MAG: hypothetical protein HGA38_04715 [Candidatus Moranbacteria bacterium]|nr:hypothetical protein [Candidatus Moranbacteria bacterium]NTW46312.1 hypothetical protein [Candidatus Moranbacteria bacterium]